MLTEDVNIPRLHLVTSHAGYRRFASDRQPGLRGGFDEACRVLVFLSPPSGGGGGGGGLERAVTMRLIIVCFLCSKSDAFSKGEVVLAQGYWWSE